MPLGKIPVTMIEKWSDFGNFFLPAMTLAIRVNQKMILSRKTTLYFFIFCQNNQNISPHNEVCSKGKKMLLLERSLHSITFSLALGQK